MHILKPFLISCLSAFCLLASASNDKQKIIDILDSIAVEGHNTPQDFEYLHEKLSSTSDNISELLVQKLSSGKISEKQKAVYIWALGLVKDPNTHDTITGIYNAEKDKESLVAGNCLAALVMINAPGTGDFVYDILKSSQEPESRFNMMMLLARLQYEKALPDFTETLDKEQWRSMILFGKMGEKSVPVLIEKLEDPNPEIRGNAAFLLGHFIMSEAAPESLIEQYRQETFPALRTLIIGGLERTVPDLKEQEVIFRDFLKTEEDPDVRKFLQESLAVIPKIRKETGELLKMGKKTNHKMFDTEYKKLFDSYGKEGDYKILTVSSKQSDDGKLLKLRERMLEIESDEAFSRVERLNKVIINNRIKEKLKNERQ